MGFGWISFPRLIRVESQFISYSVRYMTSSVGCCEFSLIKTSAKDLWMRNTTIRAIWHAWLISCALHSKGEQWSLWFKRQKEVKPLHIRNQMNTHLFLKGRACFLMLYIFQRESNDIHSHSVITWHVNASEHSCVSDLEGKFIPQQEQPDTDVNIITIWHKVVTTTCPSW